MITGATHAKRVHDPVVPDVDEITVIADKIEPQIQSVNPHLGVVRIAIR